MTRGDLQKCSRWGGAVSHDLCAAVQSRGHLPKIRAAGGERAPGTPARRAQGGAVLNGMQAQVDNGYFVTDGAGEWLPAKVGARFGTRFAEGA